MDILLKLRKERSLTQMDLSEYLGISRQAVANYESGKREPDFETLRKLSKLFNVSTDLLIENKTYFSDKIRIPVLGDVAAGIPIEAITDVMDYEEISPDLVKDGSEFFALRIKGDSMEPKISDGDVVIVRKQEDVDSGQIAIVCINGESATCKKIMKHPGGILLQPFNTAFPPTFYTTEDILKLPVTILGRVVELRAKF